MGYNLYNKHLYQSLLHFMGQYWMLLVLLLGNVVWQDPLYTARAMLKLSKSYDQVKLGDSRAEETSDTDMGKIILIFLG